MLGLFSYFDIFMLYFVFKYYQILFKFAYPVNISLIFQNRPSVNSCLLHCSSLPLGLMKCHTWVLSLVHKSSFCTRIYSVKMNLSVQTFRLPIHALTYWTCPSLKVLICFPRIWQLLYQSLHLQQLNSNICNQMNRNVLILYIYYYYSYCRNKK